ncbi:MAG: hypothetical protein ACE366_01700 [Bradymonadia bacterium]
MNTRTISVVSRFELRQALRAPGGVLFLALFGIFFGWVLLKLHGFADELITLKSQIGNVDASSIGDTLGWLSWLIDIEGPAFIELLQSHSPFMVLAFYLVIGATPFMALLASFDQMATDINTRHLRFLLLRADRQSIFVGKALAAFQLYAIATGIYAFAAWGIGVSAGAADVGEVLYVLRIWATCLFFALPFIALSALNAVWVGNAMLGLLASLLYIVLAWMMGAVASYANPAMVKIGLLSPSAWKYELLLDDFAGLTPVLIHVVVFTVIAGIAGFTIAMRRDV